MLPYADPAGRDDSVEPIVPDNINAVGTIYFASQLEALRAFDVAERLIEQLVQDRRPGGRDAAPAALMEYAFNPDRLSKLERQHLYARTFGTPGAAAIEGEINLEFNDLWLRFVSSVADASRQRAAGGGPRPPLLAQPHVRRAAAALAANLSRHGSDSANVAAKQLHRAIEQLLRLLQAPDLLKAIGAASMWEVIERINVQHLGGAVDIARARTRAQAGSHIIAWLAAHAAELSETPGAAAPDAKLPPDADLITTVEHWLAASGIPDSVVEQSAQPSEAPAAVELMTELPTLGVELMEAVNRIEFDTRSRASGVRALFAGPEASARTLAAQMLASRLSRDLYRVDLGALVAAHMGDAAKNLDEIFGRARETGAALLFDEADALFGKRTEVADAHDRYANQAASYLLQQIEAHAGLVILASNRKDNLDDAMLRRMRYVIDFPVR